MEKSNFSLRLLPSLHKAAQRVAEREQCSVNQLINLALAEKLAVLDVDYWEERKRAAAQRPGSEIGTLLRQLGGNERLRQGDELPAGFNKAKLRNRLKKRRATPAAHPA